MTRDELRAHLGTCTHCGRELLETAREVCTTEVTYGLDLAAEQWFDSYTGEHEIWEEADRECFFECWCATTVEPEQAVYLGALIHGWSPAKIAEELAKC